MTMSGHKRSVKRVGFLPKQIVSLQDHGTFVPLVRLKSRSSGADRNRGSAPAERIKAARRALEWVALNARKARALGSPTLLGTERTLDEHTRAAEVAAALVDNTLAAVASGIQRRVEIDHSTVRVCAPQPRSEGPLVGQLGRWQRMKFRGEQFCIIARYAKGYERAGVPETTCSTASVCTVSAALSAWARGWRTASA
jgi:hypothetical protein